MTTPVVGITVADFREMMGYPASGWSVEVQREGLYVTMWPSRSSAGQYGWCWCVATGPGPTGHHRIGEWSLGSEEDRDQAIASAIARVHAYDASRGHGSEAATCS
jgi:hypothetical protein